MSSKNSKQKRRFSTATYRPGRYGNSGLGGRGTPREQFWYEFEYSTPEFYEFVDYFLRKEVVDCWKRTRIRFVYNVKRAITREHVDVVIGKIYLKYIATHMRKLYHVNNSPMVPNNPPMADYHKWSTEVFLPKYVKWLESKRLGIDEDAVKVTEI